MLYSQPQVALSDSKVKITAIRALQPRRGATLIKVETDAGVSGYGPCHGTGPFVRAAIAGIEGPRLPHLGLMGKDPLAIDVHFHNMFYAYPQRGRVMGVLSAIDIALWDLAGKLLGQPVCRLLGGLSATRFRSTRTAAAAISSAGTSGARARRICGKIRAVLRPTRSTFTTFSTLICKSTFPALGRV